MLNFLKKEANMTYTENGGTAYRSTESFCLDMFFKAGAMRNSTAEEIADVVTRAYAENPDKTTARKIVSSELEFAPMEMKIVAVTDREERRCSSAMGFRF